MVITQPAALVRPAMPRFVARDYFNVLRFGGAAEGRLSPHFRNAFLAKVEEAQTAAQLVWHQSSDWSNRSEMVAAIQEWTAAQTTLTDLAWLLNHSDQSEGALLAGGGLNFFNILDCYRQPRYVLLFERRQHWHVGVSWADYDGWLKRRQVRFFSAVPDVRS
jgi:hypothetical protein